MKVFISWSGDLSKKIAEVLHDWIEDVLQGTDAWISTDDIDKGSLWFSDIANGLSETGVGILCLTKDNISAPWLLFEAGALSKGLTKSRVCPFLVNLTPADLKPPLSQFNAAMPTKEDMLKLVKTINSQKVEKALTDDRLLKAFDRWWNDFETKFTEAIKSHKSAKAVTRRSPDDMIEEVLEIVRSLQNSAQKVNPILPPVVAWHNPNSFALEQWIDSATTATPSTSDATLDSIIQSIEERKKTKDEKVAALFRKIAESKKKEAEVNAILEKRAEEKKRLQDSKKEAK